MLVLSRNQDFHVPGLFALIDGDLNGHQTIEIFEQLFGLIVQVTLLLGTQTTMARCDLDLHPCAPCMIFLPAPLLAKLAIIKNYPVSVHSVKTTPRRSLEARQSTPKRMRTVISLSRTQLCWVDPYSLMVG
jgi:hypothetical protein